MWRWVYKLKTRFTGFVAVLFNENFYVIFLLKIPKLFQWLLGGGLFIAVWLAFVLEKVDIQLTDVQRTIVLIVSIVAPIKSPS